VIAGDAAVVRRGADDLHAVARQLATVADGLSDNAVAATRGWKGAGAEAALAGLVRLGNHARIGSEVLTRCGDVLRAFADDLAAAQRQADIATADLDRVQAGRNSLGTLEVANAMRRLQVERAAVDAQGLLDAATRKVLQENTDAAVRVRALTGELAGMVPPPPGPPPGVAKSSIGAWVHGGLDVLGLVPVFGEPADAVNGIYYALEGDKLNAGLSMAAIVPGAGAAATGGKLSKRAAQLAADAKKAAAAEEALTNAARFGYQPGLPIPGAELAWIPPQKLVAYALNPEHEVGGHKARVLRAATGFDQSSAEELGRQLLEGVRAQPAVPHNYDGYGHRFDADIPVVGPTGNAVVRTGWIIEVPGGEPRLTTAYIP
jgi:filamentous hemagglutinin